MALSLVFIALSALICLFGPTALAVIMIKKRGAKLRAFLLGAVVFAVFQLLIRIPLLNWLGNTAWFTLFAITQPVPYMLLLAFTAGLFEEAGRYAGIRLLLKPDMLSWQNAFVFGLGHGGIEAFALAGINYAVLFVQALGGRDIATVMRTPASYFLADGVERVLAVALHIGFTMLVFYAVRHRKPLWLAIAIAAHTVVDTAALLIAYGYIPLGVWATEGVLAAMAAVMVFVTIRFKPLLKREELINEGGTL
jgi:Predicted membrane protein